MIVALPSMKTVPSHPQLVRAVPGELARSRLARVRDARGVRLIAALPAGVALLLRSRSATPEAVSNPFGKTDAGSEPVVHGESGPRSAVRYASPMLLRAASKRRERRRGRCTGAQQVSFGT